MPANAHKPTSTPRRVKVYTPVEHHIRAWRLSKGWTIGQLAQRADLTESFISQLERGYCNYTQPTLQKIAKALDAKPFQLLAGEPKPIVADGMYRFTITTDNDAYNLAIDARAFSAIPFERHPEVANRVRDAVERAMMIWPNKSGR